MASGGERGFGSKQQNREILVQLPRQSMGLGLRKVAPKTCRTTRTAKSRRAAPGTPSPKPARSTPKLSGPTIRTGNNPVCRRIVSIEDANGNVVARDVPLDDFVLHNADPDKRLAGDGGIRSRSLPEEGLFRPRLISSNRYCRSVR